MTEIRGDFRRFVDEIWRFETGFWADLIVWLPLQPAQIELYQSFLSSPAVQELLNTTRSPLAAISVLKKICDSADYPELRVGECSNGRLGL